mmetsp:Transcript_9232/g.24933  ORF Transcript_9232/g.24933 Transcript_9232/m.24933 type:complete len:176 (-) Transcript_9232:332-859(-)
MIGIFVMLVGTLCSIIYPLGLNFLLALAIHLHHPQLGEAVATFPFVAVACGAFSLVSFVLYSLDRMLLCIPERILLTVDAAGGWPGGFIAQRAWRHKVRKMSFQRRFWCGVVLHIVGWLWCYGKITVMDGVVLGVQAKNATNWLQAACENWKDELPGMEHVIGMISSLSRNASEL